MSEAQLGIGYVAAGGHPQPCHPAVGEELCPPGVDEGVRCPLRCSHYHAQMTADEREKVQRDWSMDKLQVICATIAFGECSWCCFLGGLSRPSKGSRQASVMDGCHPGCYLQAWASTSPTCALSSTTHSQSRWRATTRRQAGEGAGEGAAMPRLAGG